MTNEEAIKILSVEKELHTLQLTTSNDNHYEKIQALDMAISALTEKADLISRTDLLNKIWQKEYGKDYDGVNMLNIPHIDIIEQIPSAEKTESEKLDDIIVRVEVQNIYDLLTRHTALLNDIKMMLPKTAEWISVRKQKPEDYEEVIATVRYDYGNKQEYEVVTGVRYSKDDGWEWAYEAGADYWESINGVVVAWQPLPKPYEVKR